MHYVRVQRILGVEAFFSFRSQKNYYVFIASEKPEKGAAPQRQISKERYDRSCRPVNGYNDVRNPIFPVAAQFCLRLGIREISDFIPALIARSDTYLVIEPLCESLLFL